MRALRASAVRLLLVAGLAGLLTYTGLSLVPSRYVAEGRVSIGNGVAGPEMLDRHRRDLLSPDLLLRTASALKLHLRPEFTGGGGAFGSVLARFGFGQSSGVDVERRVIVALEQRLEISVLRDGTGLAVRFTSQDPQLSADVVNSLIDRHRDAVREQAWRSAVARDQQVPSVEASKRGAALLREIGDLEAELSNLRDEVSRQESRPLQPSPAETRKIAALADTLARADAAKRDAEAQLQAVRDAFKSNLADTLPVVQQSATIQALLQQRVQLERQLTEAGATLLPAHPRMRQLAADLAGLKQQIQAEYGKIVQALEREVKAASAKVDSARREFETAPVASAPQTRSGSEATLARITAVDTALAAKREELARAQPAEATTSAAAQHTQADVTNVSRAPPGVAPPGLRRGSIATVVFAVVLTGGAVLVVLHEMLRRSPGSADRMRPAHVQTAVMSPSAKQDRGRGPAVPSFVQALPGLVAGRAARGRRRTLVVGATAELDVRMEALDLARASAAAGESVLVMHWDLNGVSDGAGINDVLAGHVLFDEVITADTSAGVHLLPAGTPPSSVAAVLDRDMLNMVLDVLDDTYEHVIVHGARADMIKLFQAVEGRFDGAVEVLSDGRGADLPANLLLGFEVQGIAIARCSRAAHVPRNAAPPTKGARPGKVQPPVPARTFGAALQGLLGRKRKAA